VPDSVVIKYRKGFKQTLKAKKMNIHKLAFVLLIIGGLNWGLEVLGYGIGNYLPATVSMIVYVLVALAALYEAFSHKNLCKECA
jgi:uncharacterized membrane protein YuzA (DUF378 family)